MIAQCLHELNVAHACLPAHAELERSNTLHCVVEFHVDVPLSHELGNPAATLQSPGSEAIFQISNYEMRSWTSCALAKALEIAATSRGVSSLEIGQATR